MPWLPGNPSRRLEWASPNHRPNGKFCHHPLFPPGHSRSIRMVPSAIQPSITASTRAENAGSLMWQSTTDNWIGSVITLRYSSTISAR